MATTQPTQTGAPVIMKIMTMPMLMKLTRLKQKMVTEPTQIDAPVIMTTYDEEANMNKQ